MRVKRTVQLGTGAGSAAPSAPASTRRRYCSAPLAACAHSDGRLHWLVPACMLRRKDFSQAQSQMLAQKYAQVGSTWW